MYTTIKIIDEITGQATTNAPLYYEGPLGKPFESKINASFLQKYPGSSCSQVSAVVLGINAVSKVKIDTKIETANVMYSHTSSTCRLDLAIETNFSPRYVRNRSFCGMIAR